MTCFAVCAAIRPSTSVGFGNSISWPISISAPGNIFRANGRGIFFMKSFVDDVAFHRLDRGGMEVRMEKRVENRRRGRQDAGAARVRGGGEVG